MKSALFLALAAQVLLAQPATITDTITTPMGGNWSGTVVVSLNSPALAQPLYAGSVTLSGWSQTVTVTAGAFTIALYPNDQVTPGGTSYQAKYSPTSGAGWTETWVVPTGATTIREIRSTTLPSPSVKFNLSQLNQNGALLGQGLRWNGAAWAPGTFVADPMTTTGDLITRSGGVAVRVPIGTTGQVLTVAGGLPTWATNLAGNAATATRLATPRTIAGVAFDGSANISIPYSGLTGAPALAAIATSGSASDLITGTVPAARGGAGAVSGLLKADGAGLVSAAVAGTDFVAPAGNVATATRLATARTIAGVAFDGTANISIPYSGITGAPALAAIATSGSASDLITGTVPAARGGAGAVSGLLKADGAGLVSAAVAGTDFVAPAGNVATAATLQTARTIAGVSFNGSANIAIPSTGLSDSSDIVRGGASVATGGVLYGTAAGVAGTDANLFWDAANVRLGVGTNLPGQPLDVRSSSTAGIVSIRSTSVSGFSSIDLLNNAGNLAGSVGYANASAAALASSFYFGSRIAGENTVFLAGGSNARATINGTTGNLLLGTTTDDGTNRLQVAGSVAVTGSSASALPISVTNASTGTSEIRFANSTWGINNFAVGQDGTGAFMFANGSQPIRFFINSERARITPSGNLLLGTTTDGSFRLDIGSSGSSGTARIYDQTATTGTTQLVVRAGAGQSTTNLMTWQNSAGTQIAFVSSGGGFFAPEFETSSAGFSVGSALARGANNFRLVFSSTGSYAGSADTGLARNAAGILEVNSGTAGTFRDLYLRGIRPVGVTVANLPAAASNTGMMATVTDANATTIGTTVAGGGANTVLVWSNGTNWRIYAN